MARTSDPNSATAQFFINVGDNKFLNFRDPTPPGYGYTVFGKVDFRHGRGRTRSPRRRPAAGGPFPKDVPVERVIDQVGDDRQPTP